MRPIEKKLSSMEFQVVQCCDSETRNRIQEKDPPPPFLETWFLCKRQIKPPTARIL